MKFNLKKTLATISAICIASSMMIPFSASAGNMLGEGTFEEGKCLPWHICESATGKMEFEVSGGSFNITIVNPGGQASGGENRWDCQIRHRGLTMKTSQTYHIHAEITASKSGQFYTKIGNLNGDIEVWHNGNRDSSDFNNYWQCIQAPAGQTVVIDTDFTPTEDVDVAEWAFHLGHGGQLPSGETLPDCFDEGTVIQFDNLTLECLTSNDYDYVELPSRPLTGISLNQVGYYANRTKKAAIATNIVSGASSGSEFTVNDASGNIVYTGSLGTATDDKDSGNTVALADFSEVRTAGTYTITVSGVTSDPFDIYETSGGDYQSLTKDSLNYFFLNRGNQETTTDYISGAYDDTLVYGSVDDHRQALTITGEKVRKTDSAYISDEWKDDYKFDGSDVITTKGTIDVTGGWYDAGDYGKYVVNGGITVWTLQNIYENAIANGTTDKWADNNSDIMYIPESGDGKNVPDILDEAAVELDWFINCMQRSDGLVYHKTHDYKWTALATLPSQDVGPDGKTKLMRIVKPVTYAATLNLAATGAQGYRVWKDIDATKAQGYLDAAKNAYAAAKKLYDSNATTDPSTGASLYAPMDQNVGGGPYGDTEVSDDFYWAAAELYAATGDASYKADAEKYKDAWQVVTSLVGGENTGSKSSFNWGCTASLGSISVALNTMGTVDQSVVDTARDTTVKAAQEYISIENSQGYGIPYTGCTYQDGDNTIQDGYEWGSNSFVVNNAIVMAYAYEFTGDGDYVDGVTTAMDYILGTNPNEISYVTGYGTFALKYPHHRYWSNLLDPEFPLAPAGVLSGGPNSAMQDPYIKGMGYQINTMPPQICFIDHIEAWSTNECTINWNSPLAWNVSFMEDYATAPIGDGQLSDYVPGEDITNPDDSGSTNTNLKLDKTSVSINVGETETVTATTGTVVKWESADESVATVVDGVITGVGEGTTTITATDADGNTAKITVKVSSDSTTVDPDTTTTPDPDTTTTPDSDTTTTPDTTTTSDSDNTTTSDSNTDNDIVWGDANCDGEVKSNDLLLLKKYLLGIDDLSEQGLINCDVTHDTPSAVKSNDLLKLKKFLLGLIDDLGPGSPN